MARVWQTIFYMLHYNREDICEIGTNKLEWKKAKNYINDDFFKGIKNYTPIGDKKEFHEPYQRIKFNEKNIDGFDPEEIGEYSIALGKLFRWVFAAIDLRKGDVKRRRDEVTRLNDERNEAINAATERDN